MVGTSLGEVSLMRGISLVDAGRPLVGDYRRSAECVIDCYK